MNNFLKFSPLLGPVIGPTVGGALCQYLGWQSTFYFLAIIGFVLLLMVLVLLPETVRRKRVEMLTSDESGQEIVQKIEKFQALKNLKTVFTPMLVMLGDPTVLVITFYNTVIFSCLYFLVSFDYCVYLHNLTCLNATIYRRPQLQKHLKIYMDIVPLWLAFVTLSLVLA